MPSSHVEHTEQPTAQVHHKHTDNHERFLDEFGSALFVCSASNFHKKAPATRKHNTSASTSTPSSTSMLSACVNGKEEGRSRCSRADTHARLHFLCSRSAALGKTDSHGASQVTLRRAVRRGRDASLPTSARVADRPTTKPDANTKAANDATGCALLKGES